MSVGTRWCFLFLGGISSIFTELYSLETVSLSRRLLCTTVFEKKLHQVPVPRGEPGSLTLIDTFTHFESTLMHIYYDDVRACFCLSIQQFETPFTGIQKAAETIVYHQLVPKLAFLCKCGNTPHLHSQQMCSTSGHVSSNQTKCMSIWHGNTWYGVQRKVTIQTCSFLKRYIYSAYFQEYALICMNVLVLF